MPKLSKIFSIVFVLTLYLLSPTNVYAVCPVCTVAVIGGLGLSRFLGIDDSVSGVWVGGLILSLSFWTADWISKKKYLEKLIKKIQKTGIVVTTYILLSALTFIPMFATNFIGHPVNKIWGIDKLIFGTAVGTLFFLLGVFADQKERQIKGRQFFQFQRVVFPVVSLLVASVILYLATKG